MCHSHFRLSTFRTPGEQGELMGFFYRYEQNVFIVFHNLEFSVEMAGSIRQKLRDVNMATLLTMKSDLLFML